MRVLVTGCTGFIGYSLTSKLVEKGYKVFGLLRFISTSRKLVEGAQYIVGDLTDYFSIVRALKIARPDIIIHLGAVTPVSESFYQPKTYMEVNYGGTVNLVEATRRRVENLHLFIYASTSEVYGVQYDFPIKESATPRPDSPYSISKYASENYLLNYMYRAFNFPVVVMRPFNTYGRALVGQKHFVIEKIITSMLEGRKIIEMGNPEAVRDFMFREDHVNAYMTVIEASFNRNKFEEMVGQAFNFCTGVGVSIKKVFEIVKRLIGWDGEAVWYYHVRPTDIPKLIGSFDKAYYVLGWTPRYGLEDGLRKAIDEWKEVLFK